MFKDLEEGVLLAFVEAERLAWENLEAGEAAYTDYHRTRCRNAMRELRERRKAIPVYAERLCAWCKMPFQVRLHDRPGRVRLYCCDAHRFTASSWKRRHAHVLALHIKTEDRTARSSIGTCPVLPRTESTTPLAYPSGDGTSLPQYGARKTSKVGRCD